MENLNLKDVLRNLELLTESITQLEKAHEETEETFIEELLVMMPSFDRFSLQKYLIKLGKKIDIKQFSKKQIKSIIELMQLSYVDGRVTGRRDYAEEQPVIYKNIKAKKEKYG